MGGIVVAAGALDLVCPATLTAPAEVRTRVRLRLAEWGLARVADDVVLIASELVTNAAQRTPGRQIRVRLTLEPGAVVLAVWDPSDARPVRKRTLVATSGEALDSCHEDGRGLPIVQALSEKFGVTPTEPHGKWVWASYAITSARVLSPR